MELLLQWMRKWKIDNEMIWKSAAIQQAIFLRETICFNLLKTQAFVVSTHRSKSIQLPVYAFIMRNGIKVICRENFYGWMLSVELPQDKPRVNLIGKDIFACGYMNDVHPCYFEGFRGEWVYGGFNPDDLEQRKFSFGISNDYDFYMVMYMLKNLYPEIEYTSEENSLTKESVSDTISKIYNDFGYNEFETREGRERRIMSGWEILWRTYHTLTDYKFLEEKGIEYIPMEIVDNIDEFAEYIVKYPETRKAFAMEANMFATTF